MAKPTKNAPLICTLVSIIAFVGAVISFIVASPLPLVLLLLPAVGYEVYRTEGESTRASSIIILILIILELILVLFHWDFNLASFLGQDSQYIAGYLVPLGSITVIFPSVIAVLSIILFVRTAGIYTKWLSVIIFIGCFAIIYLLNPATFQDLLKYGIQELMNRFSYSY